MPSKGDATKQKILESACSLFYLKGYQGTTIDDILKASRVKKGSFYFHYPSKEVLGYAVFEEYKTKSKALFQNALRNDGDPIQNLFSLLLNHERELRTAGYHGGCPFGNLALELADHHPGFRMKLQAVFDGWAAEILAVLNRAKRAGKLDRSIDPKPLAYLIVAVMEGGTLLCKTKKSGGIYRDIIHTFKSLIGKERKRSS
ncbi:MAG TPA: TetR/AcrR family transcriptional regulator [Candidatus Manganitrophaceae bacterium]|nr:TetR/AcrR family transcriptional regulator [Candidatus Manganitrophaceae bacterium]